MSHSAKGCIPEFKAVPWILRLSAGSTFRLSVSTWQNGVPNWTLRDGLVMGDLMEGSIPYRHTHTDGQTWVTCRAQTTASCNCEHIWWMTEAATFKHPLMTSDRCSWCVMGGGVHLPATWVNLAPLNMRLWTPVDNNQRLAVGRKWQNRCRIWRRVWSSWRRTKLCATSSPLCCLLETSSTAAT